MGTIKHADVSEIYKEDWIDPSNHLIGLQPDMSIVRTATWVVAANNASTQSKAMADYVCDGTADDVEIQAAIDALPAGGGKVVLSEGTFTMNAVLVLDDYVTLEGQGDSTVVTLANNRNVNLISATSKSGIRVQNFKIDGNSANQTAGAGIIFTTVTESWVQNMRVEDCKGTGIFLYSASDRNIVSGCQAESCGGSGIEMRDNCDYNQIINCRSQSNGTNGFYVYATSITPSAVECHYNEFVNCYGLDNTTNGIYISHCPLNTIIGGHFEGNETGITITDSSGCKVIGSNVIANDQDGLSVKDGADIEIIGVRARNNSQNPVQTHEGIILWDTGVLASTNCVIVNCIAYDDQGTYTKRYGIRTANSASSNTIIGNVVHGNLYQINTVGTNIIKNNQGYVTENSGTATVANGQTTVTVTHGLATTPTRIQVTPTLLSNAASFWVTAKGATTFVINVNADPGAGTATFDWRAQIGEG